MDLHLSYEAARFDCIASEPEPSNVIDATLRFYLKRSLDAARARKARRGSTPFQCDWRGPPEAA